MDWPDSSAAACEEESSRNTKSEGDALALEEMANFVGALQDFQMRMSDDLSQRISSSPPGLHQNHMNRCQLGPPELYRDELIERGLLKISESTEELQQTLNTELIQIQNLMRVCPQSVSYVELAT